MKLELRPKERIALKHGLGKGGVVQMFIDNEVMKQMDPYTPKDMGPLIQSAIKNTVVGSGVIRQGGGDVPYARKHYYVPATFQGAPVRGNYWFERMKNNGGRIKILAGAQKLVGGIR